MRHMSDPSQNATDTAQHGRAQPPTWVLRLVGLKTRPALLLIALLALLLAGCEGPRLPDAPALPDLPQIPALPEELRQLGNVAEQLGLPDLGGIRNLPGVESLPDLGAPPGAVKFVGPAERRVAVGERIPGTDIVLTAITEDAAEFQIMGLRSPRRAGDSLDYDGEWPGVAGSTYSARYRIYYVGSDGVRVAGVHQLLLPNVQPAPGAAPGAFTLRFPYTAAADAGGTIPGTLLGYAGQHERGAQISGLPADEYPYRALGDSVVWRGLLRPDVGAEFDLRVLAYGEQSARFGGVVIVTLPNSSNP